jgi:DNA primase catalytic subunit
MSSVQDLELYYQYLYPYETIVDWLTYNNTRSLNHRELSFQYEGDAVQRYVVFSDANTMRERMTSRF